MKHKTLLLFAFACAFLYFTSCSEDDNGQIDNKKDDKKEVVIPTLEEVLSTGMIRLTENIGDWDVGVIYDEDGYIVLKDEPEENPDESYLQIMSPNEEYDCALYFNKDSYLPQMLICGDETRYFDYEGDSLLIVSQAQEEGVAVVDSLAYSISGTETKASTSRQVVITYDMNYDDKVKKVIKALDAVLNAGEDYSSAQIRRLTKALDDISEFYYYENVEEIIDSLDLCRETYSDNIADMIYCFAQYATKVKTSTYTSATFGITVRNDYGATNVTADAATVGGRIYCASSDFRTLGTWGIVYSTSPNNLNLDNCEGMAYASSASFNLRLTGLKANTTYYFKAFYKFNSSDHGNLHFSYGEQNAQSYVVSDWFTGSFTTKYAEINGHEYVDMGLSVKWATCNVGASSHSDYGYHFAWGETSPYSDPISTWEKSISDISGNSQYDAARSKWGSTWRMPTYAEIGELIDNCQWEWTNMDGHNGYNITGPNGNSIFLPAAGMDYLDGDGISREGELGRYWSSTPCGDSTRDAYLFAFVNGYIIRDRLSRRYRLSIRPVSD